MHAQVYKAKIVKITEFELQNPLAAVGTKVVYYENK